MNEFLKNKRKLVLKKPKSNAKVWRPVSFPEKFKNKLKKQAESKGIAIWKYVELLIEQNNDFNERFMGFD